jgi:hypothetical protein
MTQSSFLDNSYVSFRECHLSKSLINFTHSTVIRDNAFFTRPTPPVIVLQHPNAAISIINLRPVGPSK